MSKYEIMFIVKATQEASDITASAEAMKAIITDNKSKVAEFKELGEKYHKTPVQVIIRWHLDMGYICLIKSQTKSRISENFAVFDFHIDEGDMKRISELEENRFFTKEMRKQFEPTLLAAKPTYE